MFPLLNGALLEFGFPSVNGLLNLQNRLKNVCGIAHLEKSKHIAFKKKLTTGK